jgi:hypothetical protein
MMLLYIVNHSSSCPRFKSVFKTPCSFCDLIASLRLAMQPIRREQLIAGIVIGCLAIALLFSSTVIYITYLSRRQDRPKLDQLLLWKKQRSNSSKLA